MSLFNRALRPPPTWSDEAIERYLAAAWAPVEPDPLFRRRLRTEVLNRYVAVREGMISPARVNVGGRVMGRLGRATLYASFAVVATSASVLAASQEALPGDALYGLKLRVEQLRIEVLPAQLQDELAASMLLERADEMARLAARGDLGAAIALAPIVEQAYAELEALVAVEGEAAAERIEQHLAAVAHLVEDLPVAARAAVIEAFVTHPDVVAAVGESQTNNGGAKNNTGVNSNGSANSGGDNNTGLLGPRDGRSGTAAGAAATPDPGDAGDPAAAPAPSPTPEPTATPQPAATAEADPSPTASPGNSGNGPKGKAPQSDTQGDEDVD